MAIADCLETRTSGTINTLQPESRRHLKKIEKADVIWGLFWFLAALAIRGVLTARIEGALDDDQSVVGLMGLDISQGRRWPIFFDGQRYMGAIEAYTAALLIRLLGPSPAVTAIAPTLFFGLFVALQFGLWRSWSDRVGGHLAALLAAVGAPMLALWSVAPRGGYTEILAWSTAALWGYREMVRPNAPARPKWLQWGWGFLLALGYYINPLSLIIYATLALDWTFARHGNALRQARRGLSGWVDRPCSAVVWIAIATGTAFALAAGCHVRTGTTSDTVPYVFALDRLPAVFGVLWVVLVLAFVGWWTGFPARLARLLAEHPWGALGCLAALAPPLIHHLRVALKLAPKDPSLPMWIRAPWTIGDNLRDGCRALTCLLGSDPREALFTLISHPTFQRPPAALPRLSAALAALAPLVAGVAVGLIARSAWQDRLSWRAFVSLKLRTSSKPAMLALLGLIVMIGLYALQATSPDASSMRYLVMAWVFLPGLLAVGARSLSPPGRSVALGLLIVPWLAAQVSLAADLARPSPFRPLAEFLERKGVRGVVAQAPIALLVANLTAGRVGASQYQPGWPRLRHRYADRFPPGEAILCVVDPTYPGIAPEDLGRHLRELAAAHPGKVRPVGHFEHYELWKARLPLSVVLKPPAGFVRLVEY